MFRNNSHTCYLVDISDIKSLHATIIFDIPDINHTFSITSNEAF
jgi:hypothetical protein